MASAIVNFAKVLAFLTISASGIVSLYAAVNAAAIYTNLTVFTAGLLVLVSAIVVAPLFCFIAGYGMVYYLDRPLRDAILITAPVLIAWCVSVARLLRQKLMPQPASRQD